MNNEIQTGVLENGPIVETQSTVPEKKKLLPLLITIAGVFTCATAVGIYFMSKTADKTDGANAPTPTVTATPTVTVNEDDFMKTLNWELPFGNIKIKMSRMGSGIIEDSWWQKLSTRTITSEATLDDIYGPETDDPDFESLVYFPAGKKYFALSPGGYMTISLLSESAVAKKVVQKTEKIDQPADAGTRVIQVRTPQKVEYTTGSERPWQAVLRENYHVFISGAEKVANPDDKTNWLEDGALVTCYVPIDGSTDYLEFDYGLVPASSSYDACESISSMGIQSVSLVK